jgi:hypothetical protein
MRDLEGGFYQRVRHVANGRTGFFVSGLRVAAAVLFLVILRFFVAHSVNTVSVISPELVSYFYT